MLEDQQNYGTLEMKIKNKQNSTRNLVILDSYRGKFILVNMKNKNKNVVAQVNPLLKHKISQQQQQHNKLFGKEKPKYIGTQL